MAWDSQASTPSPRPSPPSTGEKGNVAAPAHGAAGFTLTELLIALGLVSVLLVGISRVFSLTSETIGTGQALSTVMRTQRAIQQQISSDLLGVGADLASPDMQSGIVPIGKQDGAPAPMILLGNFRVAAYQNEATARADMNPPLPTDTFAVRSRKIRSQDLNSNGVDTDPGEVTPLYQYGSTNWRVDTIGLFVQGDLTSQTGTTVETTPTQFNFTKFKNDVNSRYGFLWYGHLTVFNGQASRIPWQNAFGSPGAAETLNSTARPDIPPIGPQPNRNNQYAEQFMLGRFQLLMVPPVDHDNNTATPPTIVGADMQPAAFLHKAWDDPREASTNRTPLSFNSGARVFNNAASPRNNYQLGQNDELIAPGPTPSPPPLQIENCRVDIAGVSMQDYYDRLKYLQTEIPGGTASNDRRDYWWEPLLIRFDNRYRINPFPVNNAQEPFDARKMSQRSQLLSSGVTQFIVEYAGDFLTQDPETGEVLVDPSNPYAFRPDGVIDFVIVNGVRQTRWYGMPRDVDQDGIIRGNTTTSRPARNARIYFSPDVVPLRDMLGGRMLLTIPNVNGVGTVARPFEVAAPVAAADYCQVFDEVNNATNATPLTGSQVFSANVDVEDTAYLCAWGPVEFETLVPITGGDGSVKARPVPRMLRFIIDAADSTGKLKEPLRQELVFPIPVTK